MVWASMRENLSSVFAKNNGADQPVHLRSLISIIVMRLLDRIISKFATNIFFIF